MARYKQTIRQGTGGKVMVQTRRAASTGRQQEEPVQPPIAEEKEADEVGDGGTIPPEDEMVEGVSMQQEEHGAQAKEVARGHGIQEDDQAVAGFEPDQHLEGLHDLDIANDLGENQDLEDMQERDPLLRQRINFIHLEDPEVKRLRKNNHKNLLKYLTHSIDIAIREHKARMASIPGEAESDVARDGKATAVSADAAEKQGAQTGQGGEADRERQEARRALGLGGESLDEGSNAEEGVASDKNSPSKEDKDDEDYVYRSSEEEDEDEDEDYGGGDDKSGDKRKHGKGKSSDSVRTPPRGKKSVDGGDSGSNSSDSEMMVSNTVTGSVLKDIVATPSKRGDVGGVEVDNHAVQNLFQIDDRSGAIGKGRI